ncbi:hypothetical protein EDD11_000314 [Mortierella claussenii]|nr:hypothetical protein EDD11_000314 [Mortierella claussenii]
MDRHDGQRSPTPDSDDLGAAGDDFYSPMNSNQTTREPSLDSVYFSPQAQSAESDESEGEDEYRNDKIDEDDIGAADVVDSHDWSEERADDFDHDTEQTGHAEQGKKIENSQSGNLVPMLLSRHGVAPWGRNLREKMALNAVRVEMEALVHDSRHPEGSLQDTILAQPVNSQSKLRRKRPYLLREMERIESSRNPENPYQDTSDSELDEVESELELEREYEQYVKEARKPKLHLLQDGDVCYYCGALTPYEMRRTTPYPTLNQCAHCMDSQAPEGPPSAQVVASHETELRDIESNVRLNNNGWFSNEPNLHEHGVTLRTQQDFARIAGAAQTLRPETTEVFWNKIIEDMPRGPVGWRLQNVPNVVQRAKYWSRGGALVAAGMSWTGEEGDRLFQGLRRFGKHNIWAIRDHVRSRSLAEVVAIIQTMEMELVRCKYFGLGATRLSDMPMAEEADENQVLVEEQCAAVLLDRELKETWKLNRKILDDVNPQTVNKSRLFNMRTLMDMSSRLYIQNEGAGIDRDVATVMYDSLKTWLTPVVKELVLLHHERYRVHVMLKKDTPPEDIPVMGEMDVMRTLIAQQKCIGSTSFFQSLPKRLRFLAFDDESPVISMNNDKGKDKKKGKSKERDNDQDGDKGNEIDNSRGGDKGKDVDTRSIKSTDGLAMLNGLGKRYYLNAQADLAQAMAPDSDQDAETDDGVFAEEEGESWLEAPLPMTQYPLPDLAPKIYNDYCNNKIELDQWDTFWSTTAQETRQAIHRQTHFTESTVPSKRRRFRASHPLTPTPMAFDTWQEGVKRLQANSHALPINVVVDAGPRPLDTSKGAPLQSMNKRTRNYEQELYLDPKPDEDLGHKLEHRKVTRILNNSRVMMRKAKTVHDRPMEVYAPGYGVLPNNASFMHDPTRITYKTGFGLGERDRGGLWLADKNVHELVNASGYITVSDSEDEEEEERGWKRQMQADLKIEQAWERRATEAVAGRQQPS